MPEQYLMIKTKDNRKFFTYEENFPQLIEFSKTFGAEISIVKIKDTTDILDLNQLAPAICNAGYKNQSDYELITTKIGQIRKIKPIQTSKRKEDILVAKKARDEILRRLIEGEVITVVDIQEKYGLHISTACNHIRKVVAALAKEGRIVKKTGKGKYSL